MKITATENFKDRLLRCSPKVAVETLKAVLPLRKRTVSKAASKLNLSEGTIYNRLKDLKILGLLESEEGKIILRDQATIKDICVGKNYDSLKKSFLKLSYSGIIDELDKDGVRVEDLGRDIALKSTSIASDPQTVETYGTIFAKWADFFSLASYDHQNKILYPPDVDISKAKKRTTKLRIPKATVGEFFDLLPVLTRNPNSREEIAERLSISPTSVDKHLSTAYLWGLAERKGNQYQLTESGKKFMSKSEGNKKAYIRKKLKSLPIFQAFVYFLRQGNLPQESVNKISKRYTKGWKESYAKTISKKIVSWGKYADILEGRGDEIKLTVKGVKLDPQLPERL